MVHCVAQRHLVGQVVEAITFRQVIDANDDRFAHSQMTSTKERSVWRKYQIPEETRTAVHPRVKEKLYH